MVIIIIVTPLRADYDASFTDARNLVISKIMIFQFITVCIAMYSTAHSPFTDMSMPINTSANLPNRSYVHSYAIYDLRVVLLCMHTLQEWLSMKLASHGKFGHSLVPSLSLLLCRER